MKIRLLALVALIALSLMTLLSTKTPARAAGSWYVSNSGNDSNDCASPATTCASINGALNKPGFVAGDTVLVATGTYTGTGTEVVLINKDATLSGGWDTTFLTQTGMSTIDGQNARRGITVSSATDNINSLLVQNGYDLNQGGGVQISYDSTVTMTYNIIRNNTSGYMGGGIFNSGKLNLVDSQIFDNTAGGVYTSGGGGGGIGNYSGTLILQNSTVSNNKLIGQYSGSGIESYSTLIINDSTISNNTGFGGEGIFGGASTVTINNSTISFNTGYGISGWFAYFTIQNSIIAQNGIDCYATMNVSSLGYNLIGNNSGCISTPNVGDLLNVDPLLGPLQNNGGPTLTQALLFSSPAINAGNPSGCMGNNGLLTTDQRRFPRVGRCDIGAYEDQSPFAGIKTVDRSTTFPGDLLTYNIVLSKQGAVGLNNVYVTDTLPVQLDYVDNSLSAPSGSYGYSNGVIHWNGSIDTNTIMTITFGARVKPSTPVNNSIINTAIIWGSGVTFTRTATSNVASHFASASKSVNQSRADPGDSITFTITLNTNTATNPSSVYVTDTLPNYLSYIPGTLSATKGSYAYNSGVIAGNAMMSAGDSATITFGAKLSQTTPRGINVLNSAVLSQGIEVITRTASVSVNSVYTYLPFILRNYPSLGIYGHVTFNGSAASGVPLDLRFYDGFGWFTLASTSTVADGSYAFLNVPSLTSGQKYYIRYLNSSDSSRLAIWQTRSLTSYINGDSILIGNFDIANIALVSPNSGVVVTLPQTFSWGARGAVPTDSYEFNLFNPNSSNGQPWWWTVPPLGYTGIYTLNSLPSGFNINTWYGWFVAVHSPDGGYGESYYYRSIGFLNTGLGPVQQSPSVPKNIPDRSTFMPQSKPEGAR